MSPEEESHLMRLVAKDRLSENSPVGKIIRRRIARAKKAANSNLSLEKFQAVADWQHFAILSLVNTVDFKPAPSWIAERLGIDVALAKESVDRLIRLGLLEKKGGKYVALNEGDIETPHDVSSKAIRENHRQHLGLAEAALREVPPEFLEFENATIPIQLKDVTKAKKRIRHFVDQFIKDLEQNPGEEIFQVNLQFYRLGRAVSRGTVKND